MNAERRSTTESGKGDDGIRWLRFGPAVWQPLRPELVVEVRYDQVTGDRLRHGTKFLRWRPDKAPAQCTIDQIRRAVTFVG